MNKNCIFCKIVMGTIPSEKIYEDKVVLAFLDIEPVNIGHTLIIPKEHFENLYDLPEEMAGYIIKIAKKISAAIRKTGAEGTVVSMNNGEHAGQTVFHSHTHIIPRFKTDKLPSWPKIKYGEGELSDTANKIISAL